MDGQGEKIVQGDLGILSLSKSSNMLFISELNSKYTGLRSQLNTLCYMGHFTTWSAKDSTNSSVKWE